MGFSDSEFFSLHSLDKITHTSGGKYECVFLTEPEVKQTIEVKSKFGHFKVHVHVYIGFLPNMVAILMFLNSYRIGTSVYKVYNLGYF